MATTADDVWRILGELAEAQKETERRFQATENRIRAIEGLMQQLLQAAEPFQATERFSQQVIQGNEPLNRSLSQQSERKPRGSWYKFCDDLLPQACERLCEERGMPVSQISQRGKRRHGGETLEFEVLLATQEIVLAVEATSLLEMEDIKALMAKLERFRDFFPEYADMQLYGAVAGMGIEAEADRYAYRQGLFVLAQSGETVEILNDAQFQPRVW